MEVINNLLKINKLILEYENKYQKKPHSVQLVCASKGQSILKMLEAAKAGQRVFGENYVQEAMKKMEELRDYPIEWHFIGPIQSNKAPKIASHFSWVQTIDDQRIARRLSELRSPELPPLNCLIQVNISEEATKSGAKPADVLALARYIQTLPHLRFRGLMAIPAPHHALVDQRRECHKLFLLWQSLRDQGLDVDTLSMGMSEDFEAAIAEGATMIRIGSALLGKRL